MPRGKVTVGGVECKTCGKRFTSSRRAIGHYRDTGHARYKNVKVERVRVNPETY